MPVSHAHRAIFVHIPRAGGSSIEKALGIFGRENDGVNSPCPDMLFGVAGGVQMQHLTIGEIRGRIDAAIFESYFKFAFVRNPFDRIVSAYVWSEEAKRMNLKELVLDLFAPSKSRAMQLYRARSRRHSFRGHRRRLSFEEFLRDVAEPNRAKPLAGDLDRHFRLQSEFLFDADGRLLVDFVGRYERLYEDFGTICAMMDLTAQLPRINATLHRPYRDYYDEESKRLVTRMYGRDLEMLGYRFEE